MSCFAQTPSGDLDFSTGEMVLQTDPDICLAQKLTNRFRLFLGEWFLDTRIGVPYYQKVLVKNPNMTIVGQLFQRIIQQTPGVDSVLNMTLNYLANLRTMTANFKILALSGAIIQGGPGQPFIVTLGSPNTNQ